MKITQCRSLVAGLCAGAMLTSWLSTEALGQAVSACQTGAPILFPTYTDSAHGWSATETVGNAHNQLVVGDIDGDGYDELVALPNGQNTIQVWHWSYTTWTPMALFPNANITTNLPGGTATQIHLADVDGSGQKDIVVYVQGTSTSGDQEQIYKYNPSTAGWTMLTSYSVAKSDGQSYWFPQKTGARQDLRLRFSGASIEIGQFAGSTNWVSQPGSGTALDPTTIAQCGSGRCVALGDINGDGFPDLVWLAGNGYLNFSLTSPTTQAIGGAQKQSAVRAPFSSATGPLQPVLDSWQLGDIDGDGIRELVFDTPTGLAAYYFNTSQGDFVAYTDPNSVLASATPTAFVPGSLTVVPTAAGMTGAAMIGQGSQLFQFQNNAGTHSVVGNVTLENSFSPNGQLDQTGYASYLRFAVEQVGGVMLVRGPSGVLVDITGQAGSSTPFVNPNTYTDRGFPSYSGLAQTTAYTDISAYATGNNPDIRSLYQDPASPLAAMLTRISSMPLPTAPGGISTTAWTIAFQTVQNQTIAEISALQAVNTLYSVTGQLLTNTYLVKDATLEQVTDALKLASQPNVAGEVFNGILAAINTFGAALEEAPSIVELVDIPAATSSDPAEIAQVEAAEAAQKALTARLNSAGSLTELAGTVFSDVSTYAPSTLPDLSGATYSLKTTLDNSSLGAVTANACHQVASLSSWNQAKPLADGITSGLMPLDLTTQQDLQQVSQSQFELQVWQALTPQAWWIAPVTGLVGSPNLYLPTWSVNATCATPVVGPKGETSTENVPVSLVLMDPNAHNFPSPFALQALFVGPPGGVGALPLPLFSQDQNAGWTGFTTNGGNDTEFEDNASLGNPACTSISNIQPFASADAVAKPVGHASREAGTQALHLLAELSADINANLQDPILRNRATMDLDVASTSLRHALQFQQEPKQTLRLLNDVLTRLQFHATVNSEDSAASTAGVIKTVTIRDLLLKPEAPESSVAVR